MFNKRDCISLIHLNFEYMVCEKVKDNFQLRTIQLQLQVKFSDVFLVDHPDIFYTLFQYVEMSN